MSSSPLALQIFNNIGSVVLALHSKLYRGKNRSSRYKIGTGIIAVVENDSLSKIIDFNRNRIITANVVSYTVQIKLLENETTLAEDVISSMNDAIKAVTLDHIFKAYEAAKMLPEKWLKSKMDQLYRYTPLASHPVKH